MHIVRKIGLWITLFLFSSMLSLFVFSFIANQTVGNPDTLKGWLSDSNTYENFTDLATDEIRVDPDGDQQALIDTQTLQQALKESFTANDIQAWIEEVIDGTFAWLNEETEVPEFQIDYGPQVDLFIDNLANTVEAKYMALPECTTVAQARAAEEDPLNATCQVPNINIAEMRERLRTELKAEDGLFESTTFSANDIRVSREDNRLQFFEDSEDQEGGASDPFYEAHGNAPQTFSRIKLIPWLALGVSVLFAILVVFLASTKRAGIRKIGWRLITTAVVSIVGSMLMLLGTKALLGAVSEDNADQVQDIVIPFVNEMFISFIVYSVVIAVIMLVIGVITIILTRKSTDQHKKAPSDKAPKQVNKTP